MNDSGRSLASRKCSLSVPKIFFLTLVLSGIIYNAGAGEYPKNLTKQADPPFLSGSSHWVDSVMSTLTLDEKIGQLFTIASYSNLGPDHAAEVMKLISDYKVGGVIFFQGGPVRQAILTNQYQAVSKVPLLISMDAEWGLAMRLDSTLKYPYAMQMGAMRDENLVFRMASDMARQLRNLGVHIDYAPDADVNNNPANPVISMRSFGEDRTRVTVNAIAEMVGFQDNHIIAVAKHFPGHGDTQTDSHLTMPLLDVSAQRLDSIELYPFRHLIQAGISAVMCAHLHVPALDTTPNLPTSLSNAVVTKLLKEKLKFKGLIFTDALTMKGVSDYYKPGELELKAIMAGNDVLVMSTDVPGSIAAIKKAIDDSIISVQTIENSCRKILAAKQWVGLDHYRPVNIATLKDSIGSPEYELLMRRISEKSLTIAWNQDSIIPLERLDTLRLVHLSWGTDSANNPFQQSCSLYGQVDTIRIPFNPSDSVLNVINNKLNTYTLIIASLHSRDIRYARQFGLDMKVIAFLDSLTARKKVILNLFANPYALNLFADPLRFRAILLGFDSNRYNEDYAAQMLFGGIPAQGRLPISINSTLTEGKSFRFSKRIRLKYTIPEDLGICSDSLARIDTIINQAMNAEAIPGCEILAAQNGVVFFRKTYGYHTYLEETPVQSTDLYDMASVTKITATLPGLMHLYDQGLLSLNAKLSLYLPELASTNKGNLVIKDLLVHQAGLVAWIPFYLNTLQNLRKGQSVFSATPSDDYPFFVTKNVYASRNLTLKSTLYSSAPKPGYTTQVADHIYILDSYRDSIQNAIDVSPVSKKKVYVYSDLTFLLFQRVLERLTNEKENVYVQQQFYKPLGMNYTGFLPLERFSKSMIVPTENDVIFRKQLLQGYVHDPGAALLGGVAGHAGLFSNANDMAKIMQMYLWKGEYGGEHFISSSTMDLFTSCPFCRKGNRRGYGFDKPVTDGTPTGPTCTEASLASYGHTGFTGTMVWNDPENQLVYVFLSNRVHPDQNNPRLSDMNVRTNVQEIFYRALKNEKPIPF